jgi:GNAT superfamily N-acetyltransferase
MTTYALTIEESAAPADHEALVQGLNEHAARHTPRPGFKPLSVFLRDDRGALMGGAYGYVNWNWLFISLVWISEAVRGGGHGRRMILALEQAARERGCTHAHLDTFSFQARPFYEKLGYEVFSTLDDYPPGHQRFFMKKALSTG